MSVWVCECVCLSVCIPLFLGMVRPRELVFSTLVEYRSSTRYWSLCFNASNVNIHDPIWVTFSGFIYQQGVWGLPVIHWLSLSTSQGTLMGNKHLLVLLLICGISCLVAYESVNCLALLSLSWKPICSECVLNSRPNIISNCIYIHISIHIIYSASCASVFYLILSSFFISNIHV